LNSVIQKAKGDKVIWAVVLLLSLVSVIVVYSSSAALATRYKDGNSFYYLIKHGSIIALGFGLAYLTHKIKYTYYARLSQIAMIIAIPLLLFTLLKGVNVGNASRWLEIPGTGLTFQTSDFAKLALIMYVARMLSIKQDQIKDFKGAFLPIILPIIITCGFILPANFSTAAVLFTTCLVLMFIGRVNLKYLAMLVGSGIVLFAIFIAIVMALPDDLREKTRLGTWKARVENFIKGDSESNYQAEQAKIAIASGGLVGKGPGNSIQRNFLPQASSDFIYAIIIEELGFILGGLGILFLYLVLMFRAVRIVTRSPKTFGSLLAIGLCFSLVFQALINMAVAVGLFPVTGQPLPLVSMGGTSIWFTSIAVGIILGVSREVEKEEETKAEEGGGQLEAA
jgi:cell division protein FtsW